ncbi:hypothetical protein QTV44_002615 [Vibrio vulnificus]|nr:hypothetical protein [Vibrio vulnificus]
MRKSKLSPAPLYKPALYVIFSKRPDLAVYLTLQSDICVRDHTLVCSPHLASFFGVAFESSQVFLGVPERLWPQFSQLNFQSFSISTSSLNLHYHLDVEDKKRVRTGVGTEEVVSFAVDELTLELPVKSAISRKISQSAVLHMTPMRTDRSSVVTQRISLTKRFSTSE